MVLTNYLEETKTDFGFTANGVPEGYMTLEEFRTEAKASLTKILNCK